MTQLLKVPDPGKGSVSLLILLLVFCPCPEGLGPARGAELGSVVPECGWNIAQNFWK
jgi:hypothetical protein